jgi:YHS domain-containing protein
LRFGEDTRFGGNPVVKPGHESQSAGATGNFVKREVPAMANSETRPGADPDKTHSLKTYKDPVCGMDVGPNKSYSATHDNTEYRFCSLSCLEKFKADPESFVRR